MTPTRSLPRIAVAARDAAAMLGMIETKFEEHVTARLTPAVVEAVRLFAALSNGRQHVVLSTMREMADSRAG